MHINKRPGSSKPCPVFAVDEHHAWYNPDIVLPPMAELMPPLTFNDLALVDLINGPQVALRLVKKDRLEDVPVELYWRLISIVIHSELMLVVRAIK